MNKRNPMICKIVPGEVAWASSPCRGGAMTEEEAISRLLLDDRDRRFHFAIAFSRAVGVSPRRMGWKPMPLFNP